MTFAAAFLFVLIAGGVTWGLTEGERRRRARIIREYQAAVKLAQQQFIDSLRGIGKGMVVVGQGFAQMGVAMRKAGAAYAAFQRLQNSNPPGRSWS